MHWDRDRRMFLGALSCGLLGACGEREAEAPAEAATTTYVYKSVEGLDIHADVHRPPDDVRRPVAVWIHGGALINGHRESVPERVKEMLLGAGFAVVSIDYRLAPETKLASILEDVEDAFRWIRARGPELFAADASKIAVLGGSAGGYLTLATGYRVEPRPNVLVAFWGYGDLVGAWYSEPSPHERHHRVTMSREEALAQVSGPPIADSRERKGDGGAFYQHCRQYGIWPQEVSGWDPREEEDKFVPYMPVRNVTPDYPPTLLIHGTADTDVPFEQSERMARRLRENGVEHELIAVPGAEHGLAGGDPALVDAAYEAALEFVARHAGLQKSAAS